MSSKTHNNSEHRATTLASRGSFRIDGCPCGHLQMHIGYTSITLSPDSAEVVAELLAMAVHKVKCAEGMEGFSLLEGAPRPLDKDLH